MQYFVAKGGKSQGPYEESELRVLLEQGTVADTDLGWHEGMGDWAPLNTFFNLPPTLSGAEKTDVAGSMGNPPLADKMTRLYAAVIDHCLLMGSWFPGLFIALGGSLRQDLIIFVIGFMLIIPAMIAVLVYQAHLITVSGQTLGKKWTGIRIANISNNANPGFVKGVLVRYIVMGMIEGAGCVGLIVYFVDKAFIFRDDRRCIHDILAETKVVKAE